MDKQGELYGIRHGSLPRYTSAGPAGAGIFPKIQPDAPSGTCCLCGTVRPVKYGLQWQWRSLALGYPAMAMGRRLLLNVELWKKTAIPGKYLYAESKNSSGYPVTVRRAWRWTGCIYALSGTAVYYAVPECSGAADRYRYRSPWNVPFRGYRFFWFFCNCVAPFERE